MRRCTNALIFIKGAQDEVAGSYFFSSSQDWFWWKQLIHFSVFLQSHHNQMSVMYESMTSGPFSLPYLIRWWIWAAVVLLREWNVPTVHFHRLSITKHLLTCALSKEKLQKLHFRDWSLLYQNSAWPLRKQCYHFVAAAWTCLRDVCILCTSQ